MICSPPHFPFSFIADLRCQVDDGDAPSAAEEDEHDRLPDRDLSQGQGDIIAFCWRSVNCISSTRTGVLLDCG